MLDWISAKRWRAITFVLGVGAVLAVGSGILITLSEGDEPSVDPAPVEGRHSSQELIDREAERIRTEREARRAEEAFPDHVSPEWSVADTPWGRIPYITVQRGGHEGVALSCAWPEGLAPLPTEDPPR